MAASRRIILSKGATASVGPPEPPEAELTLLHTELWNFGPPSVMPQQHGEEWTMPNPPTLTLEHEELWSS